MMGRRPVCEACGLFKTCGSPVMPPRGHLRRPDLLVVGEAPGEQEDEQGKPFVGPSGRVIQDVLAALPWEEENLPKPRVAFTNAIRCRPPQNKAKPKHVLHCREFLIDEIAEMRPRAILLLGGSALLSLTGKTGILQERGFAQTVGIDGTDYPVVASVHPAYVLRNPAALSDLCADTLKAWLAGRDMVLEDDAPADAGTGADYRLVRTDGDLDEMLEDLRGGDAVAWDLETTALKPHLPGARILSIQFCARPGKAWMLTPGMGCGPAPHLQLEAAKTVLCSPDYPPLAGQNLKFDFQFVVSKWGFRPRVPAFDALIAHHLLDEEAFHKGLNGLKQMARRYTAMGDYEKPFLERHPKFYEQPESAVLDDGTPASMLFYGCGDVDAVIRLRSVFLPMLREQGLEETLALEMHKLVLCSDMERTGVRVDLSRCAEIAGALEKQQAVLMQDLEAFPFVRLAARIWAGRKEEKMGDALRAWSSPDNLATGAAEAQACIEEALGKPLPEGGAFNPGSPKQIGILLFDLLGLPPAKKTGGGAFSTDEESMTVWLEMLEESDPGRAVVENLLALRKTAKLLGTYAHPMGEHARIDGKVHASFNPAGTVTGRLSSSDPNLQNLPRKSEPMKLSSGRTLLGPGEIKTMLVPGFRGGWVAEADYKQIELMIAALLAQDPVLLDAFDSGLDIHRQTAAQIFRTDYEAVSSEQRTAAKAINFGIIYGLSASGLAKNLSVHQDTAKAWLHAHRRAYQKFWEWHDENERGILKHGFTATLFGHRRRLPNARAADHEIASRAMRQGGNSPVQGTASCLAIYAAAMCAEVFRAEGLQSRIIGQVHDSAWFEGPQEERNLAAALVKHVFENTGFDFLSGADPRFPRVPPIQAEIKTGPNLGALELFEPDMACLK